MKVLWINAAAICLLAFAAPSNAQTAEETQQQLESMKEYLRNTGLDAEALGQVEGILDGLAGQEVERLTAEEAKGQAAFDQRVVGLGKALISVNGENHEFQVTSCDTVLFESGDFRLTAQQGPNIRDGDLVVHGNGFYQRTELALTTPEGIWEAYIYDRVPFDGEEFKWQGEVEGDWWGKQVGEKSSLSLQLRCHR